jgi:hypothetical protein
VNLVPNQVAECDGTRTSRPKTAESGRAAAAERESSAWMSWSTHTREARSEFQRLYVSSLIAAVEGRAARHRERNQRLRLRLAERRLAELRRVASPATALTEGAARPVAALATVTLALVCSGAFLGLAVGLRLEAGVTAVADLALLGLTLVWFLLAVACSPRVD